MGKTEIHYRQKKLHLLKLINAQIWLIQETQIFKGLLNASALGFYKAKGPREVQTSPRWENLQGNRFGLHVKNNFSNTWSYWVVRRGSESLVTGGVLIQAPRLFSENAEDELSTITWEIGLKWMLKTSVSWCFMNSWSYHPLRSLPMIILYEFLRAVITNHHKLGSLKP